MPGVRAALGWPGTCLIVVFLAGAVGPASAQFRVCNQTLDLYNLAIGYGDAEKFETQGWWAIPANSCLSPIKDALQSRYIYLYVANIYDEPVLAGNSPMCVGREKFVVRRQSKQPWNCWVRGYREVGFIEVDTGNSTEWTTFLRNRK